MGMNWDQTRRRQLAARSMDYSERMDAAETRLWDTAPERRDRQGADRRGRAGARSNGKPTKAERLRREAAAAGISEAELRRRRRHAAENDRLLAAEARRRGIKVKELRAMIERGEAHLPALPRPSGRVIVSSGAPKRASEPRRWTSGHQSRL
jgi:hypothetical protein